jgi:hypothetical protein
MNLHGAVRGIIGAVNPDLFVSWQVSTGYTVAANGAQSPTYAAAVTVRAQVQPVSGGDLRHTDMLGLQGVMRSVYLYGSADGVIRSAAKGGDLLIFPRVPGGTPVVWLVTEVIETWPDWCHVIVTLQTDVAA